MFCQNCGAQLQPGARFCGSCGKMVEDPAVNQPTMPVSGNNPGYQMPQSQNSAYNMPQSGYSGYNPGQSQNPSYTVPLDPSSGYGQSAFTPYMSQQTPAYNTPTEPVIPNQSYSEPAIPRAPYTPPVSGQNQYTVPVSQNSGNASGGNQQGGSKRVRKLPILLGAIAAILVLVLILGLGGKDKDKDKDKDTSSSSKNTTTSSSSKNSSASNKQTEAPAGIKEVGGKRFDSDGFFFDHREFAEDYAQLLKDQGYPLKLDKNIGMLENGEQRNIQRDGEDVFYFNTQENSSGRIVKITAGHIHVDEGPEDNVKQELEAMIMIIQSAYGDLTEEQWDQILEAPATLDTDTITIYDVNVDGLQIKLTITASTFGIDLTVGEASVQSDTSDQGSASGFPEGKLRFNSSTFLMNEEELIDLYQISLHNEGIYFDFTKFTEQDGGKLHCNVKDSSGTKVGYMVLTENSAGKLTNITLTYNYQPDEDEHNNGANAVLCLIEACHGAMTQDHWTMISETEPFAQTDEYIMEQYKMDGMKATVTIREDRFFLNVTLGN